MELKKHGTKILQVRNKIYNDYQKSARNTSHVAKNFLRSLWPSGMGALWGKKSVLSTLNSPIFLFKCHWLSFKNQKKRRYSIAEQQYRRVSTIEFQRLHFPKDKNTWNVFIFVTCNSVKMSSFSSLLTWSMHITNSEKR